MTRLAILTNIPTPYREGLFARLAAVESINLTVFYCAESFEWRKWETSREGYEYEVLSGVAPRGFAFNPAITTRILRGRFDAVVVGGYATPTAQLALLTARMTGTPLVMWVESNLLDDRNRTASAAKRAFKRLFVGGVTELPQGFIVPGTASVTYLEHYGVRSNRIFEAPTTVDVDRFSTESRLDSQRVAELRAEYGLSEEKLLLYVGRIAPKKGVDVLLDAHAELRRRGHGDVGLVIVGDGPLREKLQGQSGDGVYWLGYQPDDALPEWYGLCDVFACPSYGDQWAVVVNEAMAAGLPVVASETVGATADLVSEGENGYTVPPGDPIALANRIWEVLEPDAYPIAQAMGARSREMISGFTHEVTVAGFLAAIDAVVE